MIFSREIFQGHLNSIRRIYRAVLKNKAQHFWKNVALQICIRQFNPVL